MARCPKCYETRCVCDAVQSLTRMGHPFVAVAAHVDGLREHIDVLNQEKAHQSAAIAESDIRIAGVEAERDHYRVGLAESERCVSCVEAERDAYRAALEALVGAYAVRCQCMTCDSHREPAQLRAAIALLAGHETKTGGK